MILVDAVLHSEYALAIRYDIKQEPPEKCKDLKNVINSKKKKKKKKTAWSIPFNPIFNITFIFLRRRLNKLVCRQAYLCWILLKIT
jgi:hypothetical protein